MSIDYKLANIFGTVYSQGNLLFTPDGKSVLSPVGNRVSCFDVVNNKSFTFNYEHRMNIFRIAINKQSTLMLSVDESGRGILVNFHMRTVLHHMNFKDKVGAVSFSPNGEYIAVATGRHVQVWVTPKASEERQFAPFVKHRVYTGHFAAVTSIEWSKDSRFFLTASKDTTAHIYSVHSEDVAAASTLAGHRDAVVGAYFSDDQETIYTISSDGSQFEWKWLDDEDNWGIVDRHYLNHIGRVGCAAFHAKTSMLVVGFTSGVFGLFEMPTCNQIQTLTISQNSVDFVTINETGEWLLFGAAELGQLLVWEWQSESYVLKQQSHYDSLNTVVYSPDGTKVITGSDDGKIKVWDATSGFAIVTFSQHMAAVTALKFSQRGNVLFSASLDGSVRAWDLLRYRNFRTLTAPSRVQFTSLAVDPSGELVCAGSLDDFDIHVWNVQSSQLVDRLSGHEGPVVTLDFSPDGSLLASGSWDHTARLWNFFGRSSLSEPMLMQSEVLDVTFRPDGKTLAASSLDGFITIWDAKDCQQLMEIDGRNDIGGGRHTSDRFSAKNSARGKHFTTISYSLDGSMVLAGGNSRFLCLYDVSNGVLLRRFTISKNMAIEGTLDYLSTRNMTEAGSRALIDHDSIEDDIAEGLRVNDEAMRKWKQNNSSLPGAQRGDASYRKVQPMIKSAGIQFSPTSSSFSVASTEGLLVYAVDAQVQFDPFELDVDVTVETCIEMLAKHEYLPAVIMAFRLGDKQVLKRAFHAVPSQDVPLLVQNVPHVYIGRLLAFLASQGQNTPHIEFTLLWVRSTLEYHGRYIAAERQELSVAIRAVQRFLLESKKILQTAQENVHKTEVLSFQMSSQTSQSTSEA